MPKATDKNPVTLTLLPRNHQVEGTIVDTRGKPIRGVQVRASSSITTRTVIATDYRRGDEEPSLASAVTETRGLSALIARRHDRHFGAYHPRFVGPISSCKPEDRTFRPVTLEDAGGIAGTVVDAATGRPVAGRKWVPSASSTRSASSAVVRGSAISDAQGHFVVGGLAPGVYNLLFDRPRRGGGSPRGR